MTPDQAAQMGHSADADQHAAASRDFPELLPMFRHYAIVGRERLRTPADAVQDVEAILRAAREGSAG